MSLFQCSKCGCLENTALTHGSHHTYLYNSELKEDPTNEALLSYKKILGLKPGEEFQDTCSACCPVWYTENGDYGVGPNPNPKPEEGLWHGEFERIFLPKGKFRTNRVGNLEHIETGDDKVQKWKLEKEEGT
jgi:hypothetical protein